MKAVIPLLMIPLMLLNVLDDVISGIWLAALGQRARAAVVSVKWWKSG